MIDHVEGGRYRRLTPEQCSAMLKAHGEAPLLEYMRARDERIAKSISDPLNFGFELPHWADFRHQVKNKIETFVPGGNNSAKSWLFGKLIVEVMTRRFTWEEMPATGLRILGIAQDDTASKQFQQPAVYAHLPVEWRQYNQGFTKKRRWDMKINYTDTGGFTEGVFGLPSPFRSTCHFMTVAQWVDNPRKFEGPAFHLVVIDEGCPRQMYETLKVRARKVGGHLVYGLTCVDGYDEVMGEALDGARLLKTLPMRKTWFQVPGSRFQVEEDKTIRFPGLDVNRQQTPYLRTLGCPAGHMPYIMAPVDPHKGVWFPWTHWNPFQPRGKWDPKMPAMFDGCVGMPSWKVLVRIFGWVEKMKRLAIGNFLPQVHVIPHERVAALLADRKLTTAMADDPETARSHAILWRGVDPEGLHYIFDECPRVDEGEWVNSAGERGEGQFLYAGVGSNFYKRLIREREREHGIEPVKRLGDPRGFATTESTETGTRNMFELFNEDGAPGDEDEAAMYFEPAKVRRTASLDLDNLITLLAFDVERWQREGSLSVENRPKLYVSDRCQNFIRCVLNYQIPPTGRVSDDDKNPWKDFIDAARYLFSVPLEYEPENQPLMVGGGAWQ